MPEEKVKDPQAPAEGSKEKSAEEKLYPEGVKKEGEEETPEQKTERETKEAEEKTTKELGERAEKVGLKLDATKEEVEVAETKAKETKEKEEKPLSVTELHDAAIAATEKWQTDPTTENKELAKKAVDATKKAIEDQKKEQINYEVKLPENTLLPKERAEEIVAYSRERGFSNEVAQALVERENQAVTHQSEKAMEQMDELVNVTWPLEAKNDKEIGGDDFPKNAEMAKRVLTKVATPEFINLLNPRTEENPTGTGYGNHPELLRTFVRLGKMMADDQLILGKNQGEGKKSMEELFYSNTKPEEKKE